MKYSKSSLLAATLLAGCFGAPLLKAEYEYLLTESDVTLSYTLSTDRQTIANVAGGTRVTKVADTMAVSYNQILLSLQSGGVIPPTPVINAGSPNGWKIVAVRPGPSDIAQIFAQYDFYAINGSNTPVKIPADVLSITPYYSTHSYLESSIGAYTVSGAGSTTNYVELAHKFSFTRAGTSTTYNITDQLSWGNAALGFASKDEPVFFFAINSARLSGVGEFTGTAAGNDIQGLVTVTLTIGGPRLVYATKYPETALENPLFHNPFPPAFVPPPPAAP